MRNNPNANREVHIEGPPEAQAGVEAHISYDLGALIIESRGLGDKFVLRALVPVEEVSNLERWLQTYQPPKKQKAQVLHMRVGRGRQSERHSSSANDEDV